MPKTILTDIVDYITLEFDKEPEETLKSRKSRRKWTNTTEIMEFIKRKCKQKEDVDDQEIRPCVIFIHSMDVGVLKGQEWQEILGEISQCKKIRLIVTMDNAKSGVLFTDQLLDKYNFVAIQLDTFESFN